MNPITVSCREKVVASIRAHRLVAILRGVAPEKLLPLSEALYDGGVRLLEITFSADGSRPDTAVGADIARVRGHFGDRMLVGAGTVLTAGQAQVAKDAGAAFLLAPDISAEVAAVARAQNLCYIPGALTPTEIRTAQKLGADIVKLFPAANLGAAYVKAIRAPLSGVPLMAVGGIDLTNMRDYLSAGVMSFGIGSSLTPKAAIAAGDWDAIRTLAQAYVKEVQA